MLIMPFLSLLFYQVIMQQLLHHPKSHHGIVRRQLFKPFIHEWNMGLHGKLQKYKIKQKEDPARTIQDVTATSTKHK
jgi:hypothetical protein